MQTKSQKTDVVSDPQIIKWKMHVTKQATANKFPLKQYKK